MLKIQKEKQASWSDKQKYSDIFIQLIKDANKARVQEDIREFYGAIDCIISSLFQEKRVVVRQYHNEMLAKHSKMEAYVLTFEHAVDILDQSGYLRRESSVKEGDEK